MPTQRRRRERVRHALAAGGVVIRRGDRGLEVVLAGRHRDGTWVFPKGTPDRGETPEECALREVREESGLEVRLIRPLGTIEYSFTLPGERVRKQVHFYLMEATGGDLSLHDPEYDEARWVSVEDARRLLSFDTYRDVLDRALAAAAAA